MIKIVKSWELALHILNPFSIIVHSIYHQSPFYNETQIPDFRAKVRSTHLRIGDIISSSESMAGQGRFCPFVWPIVRSGKHWRQQSALDEYGNTVESKSECRGYLFDKRRERGMELQMGIEQAQGLFDSVLRGGNGWKSDATYRGYS